MNPCVRERLERLKPCLLCGGDPHVGGLYVSDDQGRVAAPPGKLRVVSYSLCESCFLLPDVEQRVEEAVFAALAEALRGEGGGGR